MATPRARARAQTLAEITTIGRDHLTRYGAAGLSLRAVARDLGVVSSAIYRYVPSRDDLLTLLVVDAYAELGDAVEAAHAAVPADDHDRRWRSIAMAVRAWAVAEPARYGLLFGSPVPGYAAPAEQTNAPGTRVVVLLLGLAQDAERAGAVPALDGQHVPASLRADAARVRDELGLEVSDPMLVAAVLAWAGLFGAVSFEVFGQYGRDTFTDPAELFGSLVGLLGGVLGVSGAAGRGTLAP